MGEKPDLGAREKAFAEYIFDSWDLDDESECEDLAHALLGALGALGVIWHPYAVIGLMFADCMSILKDIEEDGDE